MLSLVVLACGCLGVIYFKASTSPLLLVMLIDQLIALRPLCNSVLFFFGSKLERKMICVQRLFDLQKIPQELSYGCTKVDKNWPIFGQVEFLNASVRYRPKTEIVLSNLNFVVRSGAKIGIVGRTGAGKSTMGLCISRIIELCAGKITIDGIDISKIDL